MITSVTLGVVLVGVVSSLHYAIIRAAAIALAQIHWPAYAKFSCAAFAVIAAHLAGAALYAVGFWLGGDMLELGSFAKTASMDAMDYFYFSLVNMTTLGLGDIFPTGHLRFLAGIEALNGFLLISVSASFVFLLVKNGEGKAFAALTED